jgi:hypothetical protein
MRKAFIGACLFGLITMMVSGQEAAITLDEGIKSSMSYLVERLTPNT